MATTIKSTRVVKSYVYEGEEYNISGDYTLNESSVVVSVSGSISKDGDSIGTFNAYDYSENGKLKVNMNGVSIDNLSGVVNACNSFVGEITTSTTNE